MDILIEEARKQWRSQIRGLLIEIVSVNAQGYNELMTV